MYKGVQGDSAMDFIKVRQRLRRLSEIPDIKKNNNIVAVADEENPWRIDLYLDETGTAGIDKEFSIGGICVIGRKKAWEKYIDISDNRTKVLSPYDYKQLSVRERIQILDELDGKHIEKLWWTKAKNKFDKWRSDEEYKYLIREVSKSFLEASVANKEPFSEELKNDNLKIYAAIKLTESDVSGDREKQEKELIETVIKKLASKILEEVKERGPCEFIDIKLGEVLGKIDNIFEYVIKQNGSLCRAIVEQYVNTRRKHMEILQKLVELFLHVIPLMQIDGIVIKIQYGTVSKKLYTIIADEVKKQRGYRITPAKRSQSDGTGTPTNDQQSPKDSKSSLHIIKEEALEIDSIGYKGYNYGIEAIQTCGFGNREFSKLHHIADAFLDEKDGKNGTSPLYGAPHGMIEKFDDSLNYFTDANKHFYEKKHDKAFGAILNDLAWVAVEKALSRNQLKNTGRYYICAHLKQACPIVSEPEEFYKLVQEVRSLNNESKNNTDATNTASSGSSSSSKNQTNDLTPNSGHKNV